MLPTADETFCQLRDQSDVTAIIYRFVQGADARDVDAILACVAKDVVVSFNDGELVISSRDSLRNYFLDVFSDTGTLNPRTRGTHYMANVIVEAEGDHAIARTRGVTYLARDGGIFIRGVRYRDDFSRIGGEWRLLHRRHGCDWQMNARGQVSPPLLT